jgi:hypothetical protein
MDALYSSAYLLNTNFQSSTTPQILQPAPPILTGPSPRPSTVLFFYTDLERNWAKSREVSVKNRPRLPRKPVPKTIKKQLKTTPSCQGRAHVKEWFRSRKSTRKNLPGE